jgi:cell division protein FtsB
VAEAPTTRQNGSPAGGGGSQALGARRRGGRHSARSHGPSSGEPAPRLHLGRIAVLVLVLIGASFYVSPLRAFFGQQDRYQHESAALAAARADNAAFKLQVELLSTKDYVAQVARADSMLVPPGTQVFVVKGLPGVAEEPVREPAKPASAASISVFDRLDDLWRTLLR